MACTKASYVCASYPIRRELRRQHDAYEGTQISFVRRVMPHHNRSRVNGAASKAFVRLKNLHKCIRKSGEFTHLLTTTIDRSYEGFFINL